MKRLLAIALLVILSTGCSRSAPTPPPTEPAANFPTPAPESLPLCSPADLNTSANHSGEDGTIVLGVTLINKSKSFCALANPPAVSLLEAEKIPILGSTLSAFELAARLKKMLTAGSSRAETNQG